jgi:GntR family transcriptional repressor for pyruvate dehydrogenase complex
MDALMELLRETREHSLQAEGRQEKSLASHRLILEALKRGDAAGAEVSMRQHLHQVETIVLKTL